MLVTLEAERGIKIDVANNQRLKESGFAVDGATINGVKTGNGLVLNLQSAKALNKVLGHEVTHVLEGSEAYSELEELILEYGKGEIEARTAELKKLYKTEDVKSELIADMVGDYLFGDERFIKSLAQNKNLFQRIFDEIKYLLKIAGKGTKQEKEFTRLKRAFEKVLSESKAETKAEKTKNTTDKGDAEYSLSEVKIPTREELENKDPIEVIDIATSKTQGNFAERRKQILDNLDDVISKPYLNQDTNTMIFLTRKSYTHAFNNLGDIQLNAIERLPELIENAVLTHAEKVTHGDTHANGIYTFFGAVRYNQVYPLKLKVKEYTYSGQDLPKNIREYFENSTQGYASSYDTVVLEVEEIEESPLGSVKDTNQKDSFLNPNGLSNISIADLLKLVKGKAKKYIPKERFNEGFKVDNNDIRYSLSDDDLAPIGKASASEYNVFGEDVSYDSDDLAPLREDLNTDDVKYSLTKAQLEEEQQKLLDEQRLLDMRLESGDISDSEYIERLQEMNEEYESLSAQIANVVEATENARKYTKKDAEAFLNDILRGRRVSMKTRQALVDSIYKGMNDARTLDEKRAFAEEYSKVLTERLDNEALIFNPEFELTKEIYTHLREGIGENVISRLQDMIKLIPIVTKKHT